MHVNRRYTATPFNRQGHIGYTPVCINRLRDLATKKMKLAFDAADAAGARRDAGEATRHAAHIAKMKSKFKNEELNALGQLLDLSTLDAREIERSTTSACSFEPQPNAVLSTSRRRRASRQDNL